MATFEFLLPDAGEGLTEAEIVSWRVQPGDTVAVNDVLVEIETAKSLVELPSPFAGTVSEILAEEGQTIDVGTVIITVSDDAPVPAAPAAVPDTARTETASAVADAAGSITAEAEKPGSVLVGYGTKTHAGSRRRRGAQPAAPGAASAAAASVTGSARPQSVPAAAASTIIAKPPIRKLAKDLGVDLAEVTATGLAGEITRDDVVRQATQASVFRNIQTPAWNDEREERIPVKGVRKAIATAMVNSKFTAPHVSLFVDVDATRTMEFVKRLKNSTDFAGVRVSPLLIMAKAMIWAVRRNPMVNSAWTDQEIIVRHYVNLGIAAATPRGLIVPNVKDAQSLSLLQLAKSLEQLTLTARDGKTTPADTANGTITITNIGSFGMDTGTPILNSGEVAIVALGTIKPKPWIVDGEVRSRLVTTIGASFDHRVVDGDVASRFLADVASVIEEPALLLD
jgi:2-oxoisovalerate dehydrogenase E2 component (dihydrolipoyl transacylase)